MKIDRSLNDYGNYDIELLFNDKTIRFEQIGPNLNISCFNDSYDEIDNLSFIIKHDDERIYSFFDKLYTSIVNNDVDTVSYIYNLVVDGDRIKIISDNFPFICSNILYIEKNDDNIKLDFKKVNNMCDEYKMPHSIPINIRMNGSGIGNFSLCFEDLFNDLQDNNLDRRFSIRK